MKFGDTTRQLVHDARQGIVGGVAFLLASALPVVLLTTFGGEVPSWTLLLAAAFVFIPAALIIAGMGRRLLNLVGELDESRRAAEKARKSEAFYRQQLDLRSGGNVPVTNIAALGVIAEIRALRESIGAGSSAFADKTEMELLDGLIRDARETIGESRVLNTAANLCAQSSPYRVQVLTTLSQLEAVVTSRGASGPPLSEHRTGATVEAGRLT